MTAEEEYLDHPLHVDGRGRTAYTDADDHIRDLIEQVLFTNPGERVNRPDFGCGLRRMLFMPNHEALAAATQVAVRGALQRWLDPLIKVEAVAVRADEEKLVVRVVYRRRSDGVRNEDVFTEEGPK